MPHRQKTRSKATSIAGQYNDIMYVYMSFKIFCNPLQLRDVTSWTYQTVLFVPILIMLAFCESTNSHRPAILQWLQGYYVKNIITFVSRSLKAWRKNVIAVWWSGSKYFCVYYQKQSQWTDFDKGGYCLLASFGLCEDTSLTMITDAPWKGTTANLGCFDHPLYHDMAKKYCNFFLRTYHQALPCKASV